MARNVVREYPLIVNYLTKQGTQNKCLYSSFEGYFAEKYGIVRGKTLKVHIQRMQKMGYISRRQGAYIIFREEEIK